MVGKIYFCLLSSGRLDEELLSKITGRFYKSNLFLGRKFCCQDRVNLSLYVLVEFHLEPIIFQQNNHPLAN